MQSFIIRFVSSGANEVWAKQELNSFSEQKNVNRNLTFKNRLNFEQFLLDSKTRIISGFSNIVVSKIAFSGHFFNKKPDIIRVFFNREGPCLKLNRFLKVKFRFTFFPWLRKAIQFSLRSNFICSIRNKPDFETLHFQNHNRFPGKLKNVYKAKPDCSSSHLHKKLDRLLSNFKKSGNWPTLPVFSTDISSCWA